MSVLEIETETFGNAGMCDCIFHYLLHSDIIIPFAVSGKFHCTLMRGGSKEGRKPCSIAMK